MSLIKKLGKVFSKDRSEKDVNTAGKLPKKRVSAPACKVVARLQEAGYDAYLVGGSVRDLLLGKAPKDYDIATNAEPEDVRAIFHRSRIIGRRFRLVHVYMHGDTIEVSTFRAAVDPKADERTTSDDGMILSDNVYGSFEEDAWRRDFTINAFYYDPTHDKVIDVVGGMPHLKKKEIHTIGDPLTRFREDPIRMIRALRFSAKLEFVLDPALKKVLLAEKALLENVPHSRLYDAFVQVFFAGYASAMYRTMKEAGYFSLLFPNSVRAIAERNNKTDEAMISAALLQTDKRFHSSQSLNPGFLLSVILWPYLQNELNRHIDAGMKFGQAMHLACDTVLADKPEMLQLTKRVVQMMRDVWFLQFYLERRRRNRIWRVANDRYFRAAYDFLLLRAEFENPDLKKTAQWWEIFRDAGKGKREGMIKQLSQPPRRRKKPTKQTDSCQP